MKADTAAKTSGKPSALLDTRVIYCGDNLEQLKKFPDACIDLIRGGGRRRKTENENGKTDVGGRAHGNRSRE